MTLLQSVRETSAASPERLTTIGPCRALQHDFDLSVPRMGGFVEELGSLVRPFRTRPDTVSHARRYDVAYSGEAGQYVLSYEGRRIAGGRCATDLQMPLAWHINQRVIDSSVDRYLLMHGAAVTTAGITVVMPADQECGKTTTAAGLLRHGYDYVTDEAVAIDPSTGAVVPFPKTLSLDAGSWELFPELCRQHHRPRARQWHVSPGDLGAGTERGPLPRPSFVVIPQYVGGERTAVEPLPRGEAVRELALLTFEFDRHVGRNLRVLAELASRATIVRLTIGSLDAAIDCIDQLISNRILEDS